MPPGFHAYLRNNQALRAGTTGSAASLAASSLFGPTLPSIAPRGPAGSRHAGAAGHGQAEAPSMHGGAATRLTSASWPLARRQAQNPAGAAQAEEVAIAAAAREREIKLALSDYLDRQARLPPSGATGFDPRLSPAWSGRKLAA